MLITLETGQLCFGMNEWAVQTGGEYAPDELVTLVRPDDATQTCAMYAQFISEGTYP